MRQRECSLKSNILLSYIVVVPQLKMLCCEEISVAALASLHEGLSVMETICTMMSTPSKTSLCL